MKKQLVLVTNTVFYPLARPVKKIEVLLASGLTLFSTLHGLGDLLDEKQKIWVSVPLPLGDEFCNLICCRYNAWHNVPTSSNSPMPLVEGDELPNFDELFSPVEDEDGRVPSYLHDLIREMLPIPEEVQKRLPLVPDHVRAAREDCTYRFIQEIVIPAFRGSTITFDELAEKAEVFVGQFRQEHPNDLVGEFDLLPATKAKLIFLQIHYASEGDDEMGGIITNALVCLQDGF